jgi:hypothetical protein
MTYFAVKKLLWVPQKKTFLKNRVPRSKILLEKVPQQKKVGNPWIKQRNIKIQVQNT